MSVEFKHGRLFVGWRRRDMSKVWYTPVTEDETEIDADGNVPLALYKVPHGDAGTREPMEAEVMFLSHFIVDKGDADGKDGKKTRESMQMQFIWDAWRYLNERDRAQVAQLEQKWAKDKKGYRKWESWFHEAKKFKTRQMNILDVRRINRRQDAINMANILGGTPEDTGFNSDSTVSGEDSGFESDSDRHKTVRMSNPRPGPAPPDNGAGGSKRPTQGGESSGNASKKSKPDPKGPQKSKGRGKGRKELSPPRTSGGQGKLGLGLGNKAATAAERRIKQITGRDSTVDPDSDDEGTNSMYDTRPSDHYSRVSLGSSSSQNGPPILTTPRTQPDLPLPDRSSGSTKTGLFVPEGNVAAADNGAGGYRSTMVPDENVRNVNGGQSGEEALDEAMRRGTVLPE